MAWSAVMRTVPLPDKDEKTMDKENIITIMPALIAMTGQAQGKTAPVTGYSPVRSWR